MVRQKKTGEIRPEKRKTAASPELNPGAGGAVSAAAATRAGLGDLELRTLTEEDAHLIPRGWEVVEGGKTERGGGGGREGEGGGGR